MTQSTANPPTLPPVQLHCEQCGSVTDHCRNRRAAGEVEQTCVECGHVYGDANHRSVSRTWVTSGRRAPGVASLLAKGSARSAWKS